jgi:hypothetical protein
MSEDFIKTSTLNVKLDGSGPVSAEPESNETGADDSAKTRPNEVRLESDRPPDNETKPVDPKGEAGDSSGGAAAENQPPPIDVAELLAFTPLAQGENSADYRALVAEVESVVKPEDFIDRLVVGDIAHALWEERRYRCQQVALTNATRFKALVCLALPFAPHFEVQASELALAYFGAEPENRDRTRRILLRYGITDDAINAEAAELHAESLGALDRLIGNRQLRRDTILKEFARRRRKAEKRSASPSRAGAPRVAVAA